MIHVVSGDQGVGFGVWLVDSLESLLESGWSDGFGFLFRFSPADGRSWCFGSS